MRILSNEQKNWFVQIDWGFAPIEEAIAFAEFVAIHYNKKPHMTYFRFSDHWKCLFGTINSESEYFELRDAPPAPTLCEAIHKATLGFIRIQEYNIELKRKRLEGEAIDAKIKMET